ncbi:MAG: sensor domain-containing protein, partial [Actinomycetota bacterium]
MPRALRAPVQARTWRETLYLLLNLPVGIVTFTVAMTFWALGIGLLTAALIGIPILIATIYVSRAMAGVERARAKALLGVDVPAPYRPAPVGTWWRVQFDRFKDPATYLELGYHLLLLPIGIFTFTVALTLWAIGIGLVTSPSYGWALPEPISLIGNDLDRWLTLDTPWDYTLAVLLGALVILVTPWVVRGLAVASGSLVRGMLGADVTQRMQTLTETR